MIGKIKWLHPWKVEIVGPRYELHRRLGGIEGNLVYAWRVWDPEAAKVRAYSCHHAENETLIALAGNLAKQIADSQLGFAVEVLDPAGHGLCEPADHAQTDLRGPALPSTAELRASQATAPSQP